jgi:hypothetical protein
LREYQVKRLTQGAALFPFFHTRTSVMQLDAYDIVVKKENAAV